MRNLGICGAALLALAAAARAQPVTFDFNNGPVNTATPVDQFSGGMSAHFAHESIYPYAIWASNVFGFTPAGFSGYSLWPATVYRSDLYIDFSTSIDSISMLYAPQELNTSSSCTMRLSAYMGPTFMGYVDYSSTNEGVWPSDTLAFGSTQPFDRVVVHYQAPPPTGGDYGPIFAIDNVTVNPVPEPATWLGLGLALAIFRRRCR